VTAQLKKFKDQQSSFMLHFHGLVYQQSSFMLHFHGLEDQQSSFRGLEEHEAAILSSFRKLAVMESIFPLLLGNKIRYQMGEHGPNLDLFFLCVLMNRKELAFEFWKQCGSPVSVAIVAVRLLHLCPRSVHAHNQSAQTHAYSH
jgi:hypothetical protein